MTGINKIFFELIRVAIGTQDSLSCLPSTHMWGELYKMTQKQSLVGVCFAALQRLGADADEGFARIGISEMQYLTWMGMTAKIQQRNEHMNGYTMDALELFRNAGFQCTNLKGQGIAQLYVENLQKLRQSGDIDLWVMGSRKALYEYSLKAFGKLEGLTYHHIHFPALQEAEIEAHTWPSFLASPMRNKRLQEFCKLNATNEDVPSLAFNRVFILLHCYQHFTRRGVGMRQLLDYYFVLIASQKTNYHELSINSSCEDYKAESMKWISALGMKRFAEATMWLMKEIFGLEDKYLLCEPNGEYGRFLLEEVMQTGNMGHADERVDHKQLQSAVGRYFFNLKRDVSIIKICPHEALWEPLWGIYQFAWCKLTQLKYKR